MPNSSNVLLKRSDVRGFSGRDPRRVGVDALESEGFKKSPLLRVIRAKCLDCCGQLANEVRYCPVTDCSLWPYRMGKNPFSTRKGNAGNFKK